ncbi:MAG: Flp pilus assembly complex ATPase component TadA [Phycisphaerales bacterium]|nr:Flp pilus assembly complex ATPase component TadA [Phycisphaerales bacterium]
MRGRPLGRILVKMKALTPEQVQQGLEKQRQQPGPLGEILVELELIDTKTKDQALAHQAGMEFVDLETLEISREVIKTLDAQVAKSYNVIPIDYDEANNHLTIAMDSPSNFRATDDLQTLMGFVVTAKVATPKQILAAMGKHYASEDSLLDLFNEVSGDEALMLNDSDELVDLEHLRDVADSNPVKRLVNMVLLEAIRNRASDIHFEPFEKEFKMRYRIDGILYEMLPPPKQLAMAISSRIKVMSNLDIAERRLPQDGRIELMVNGNPVDLRVAVLPTMFGESVVMRVLDRSNVSLDLEKLGLREDDLRMIDTLIHRPHGIVVVTGPTGSGKTTTLYSALNTLNEVSEKILTAEDPVEYDIDGLIQCQINEDVGMTFAKALRSFLRQDPDIVLVGEMRDLETAQISVQAALTGHLVFSTLHTNDAPSSIARLLDLGLEPFLVTATLEAIIAQRLVRTICTSCKTEIKPTEEMLMELNLVEDQVAGRVFYHGTGCEQCRNTGYRGRMALYEIMVMDDELREMVIKRKSSAQLREAARKRGMRSLRESGLLAIYDGMTSIEEVVSQTMDEDLE